MTHIAMIIPSLGRGGAERSFLTVARGLAARGHKVDLVLFGADFAYVADVPAEARLFVLRERADRPIPPGLPVRPEWQPVNPLLLRLRKMKLAARLLAEFPADARITLNARGLRYAARLHRYVRSEKPEILLAKLPTSELAALYALRLDSSGEFPPIIPVICGLVRKCETQRRRLLFPSAQHVVTISGALAERLSIETDTPEERISAIYNPADVVRIRKLAEETPDHPWFEDGGPPVVLGAGRLDPQKDFPTLIEAFRRVRAERPCRLVVVGEGRMRAEIEDRIRALGLENHVSLPGWVDNPFAFMARAELFVLSSLHEGLGNVLVEAMICGCPAVSTDCPDGPAEVVRDPDLLAPAGDPDALARVMLRSLNRQVDRSALSEKTKRFSMERTIQAYEAVIAEATG